MSSDTPAWATSFWAELPSAAGPRKPLVEFVLVRLSHARASLPAAAWEVTLDGKPVRWDPERSRFP